MGLGAGSVGALIWYAVVRITGWEIGLIAVVIGFMVGKAVRKGSGGRGGRGYQLLAAVLTYCCIAVSFIPMVLEGMEKAGRELQAKAAAQAGADGNARAATLSPVVKAILRLAFAFVFSLAVPFLLLPQNLIGLLIIGFAVWEAWKFNARRQLPISGPFQLGSHSAV